jgi:lipopolysaccharide transport system permease protein
MSDNNLKPIRGDTSLEQETYKLVIERSQGLLRIDWRELFHYRDLLFLLVRRDFLAQYKQTVLGPLWFVIQPLMTTLVFTIIFGFVAKIPTDGVPPMLFYLCGMSVWSYFAACLGTTASTFIANSGMFGKVYFPRLIVPLSVVISRLIAFGIQLGTFLAFLVYFKFYSIHGAVLHPSWLWLAAAPLLVIQSAALGLGVGLWISAMTTKYRDFAFLAGFLTQLWMYASPVVYPISQVPERWLWLAALNPMTGIIEAYRKAFLGTGMASWYLLGISFCITALVLVTGLIIFSRAEKTFVDTV